MAKRTGLTNPDLIVDDWTKLASMEKLADCAFITTQDRMHLAPAMAFASKGYHLLLEKPMSVNEEECKQESYLHIYSKVPNNSAARLLIFKKFTLPTRLIWTYTLIKIQTIFLPTRLLSTKFYFFVYF